jgi:hypothetical protein
MGKIANGAYSTQSVGPFVANDCLTFIDYHKGQNT